MSSEARYAPNSACLDDVLETIREFGSASLGLVAWELCLPEQELRPLWQRALREGLIRPAESSPETSEPMFSLAAPAKRGRVRVGRPSPAATRP